MKNDNPCPYSPSCFTCPLSDCKAPVGKHYNPMPHEHCVTELAVSRGGEKYTEEQKAFILKYSYLKTSKLTAEFNRKFHTSKTTCAISHKRDQLKEAMT